MADPIAVMVVDGHTVLGSGLRLVVAQAEGLAVAGEGAAPDVVLIDLEMPDAGGQLGLDRLQELRPELPVIVLSIHGGADDVRRAFAAGASGYVLKTAADEELIRAIRAVASGDRYLHPSLGAALARPDTRGAVDELSRREREVLRLLALGHTNQAIAQELYVSVRTVESHRAHIMSKLGAASRAEMVHQALAGGLLEDARG